MLHKRVKNYVVRRRLGEGSFGKVYEAVDKDSFKTFAVKVVPKNQLKSPELLTLMNTEVYLLSRVHSENVIFFK